MPVIAPEQLTPLSPPIEILELSPGQQIALRVLRWEQGSTVIVPRDGRPPRAIHVLRVHVPQSDRPGPPYYWDITSGRLAAGLLPHLEAPGYQGKRFKIMRIGIGPAAQFPLTVEFA